ncbi:hypothetical protein LVD15_05695 [Fulvivirga maritima]|uniref:hypothetical protein n=1 Tax=Fulvivirga maritima TaxID=2904247 RepID=UPI001F3D91C9|nr:hypothetical protein [Fulvivirga maritima]UII27913.1 hypothetical protein LVD15_05695 [Fulvivirga maritima]
MRKIRLFQNKGNIVSGTHGKGVLVFAKQIGKNYVYYAFVPDQEDLYDRESPLNKRRRIKWFDKEGDVFSYNSDSEATLKYGQSFKEVKKSE